MTQVIGTHQVRDFKSWLTAYNDDDGRRRSIGLKTVSVAQGAHDPNFVAMHWEVDNLDAFRQMLADPGMKDKMEEAGVSGPFDYFVLG